MPPLPPLFPDLAVEEGVQGEVNQPADIEAKAGQIFSGENIDLKSQVAQEDIGNVIAIDFLAGRVPACAVFVQKYLRLKVSQDRQGRKEFVQLVQGSNDQKPAGMLKRIFGGGGDK